MSRPVRERLAELSADVEQVRLAPAAAVRARGRSRSRRRWAGAGAALATAVAAAGFGLASVAGGDPAPVATLPAAAPSGNCKFPVDLTLPTSPGEVKILVVGSADQAGQVAGELGDRGFSARGPGWIDPDSDSRGTVAVLRYGPRAIGDATLVQALVGSDAVMKFQPHWDGRTIELVLGSEFRRLATTTEVNQNLVAAGEPTRPPGC
jgi:hypothetical protein